MFLYKLTIGALPSSVRQIGITHIRTTETYLRDSVFFKIVLGVHNFPKQLAILVL